MNITQEQTPTITTMQNLLTFHNGFQVNAEMAHTSESLIYVTKNAFKACDIARARINDLGLSDKLKARVIPHNTLIVEQC